MRLFHLLLFAVLLNGCSSLTGSDRKKLIKVDEIAFPVGYAPSRINYFKKDNYEIFGFLDYQTFKVFSVFTSKGEFIYSFSINELMKNSEKQFNSFSFQSIDTIAFLSKSGTNRLVLLDSVGYLLLDKDYSFLREKEASIYAPFILNNNIIRTAVNYNDTIPVTKLDRDYYQNFFTNKILFYNLMTDTVTSYNSAPSLQIDSFYSRFTKNDEWSTEANKILFLKDKNIIYSAYSDSVYIYDIQGNLMSIKHIKSKNHKLYVNPISIDENTDVVENIAKNTSISYLLWDEYRNFYYCFVAGEKMKNGETPFTIIILDDNFDSVDEIIMNHEKYYFEKFEYYPAFIGEKGLYIMNQSKSIKETKFSIFKYE